MTMLYLCIFHSYLVSLNLNAFQSLNLIENVDYSKYQSYPREKNTSHLFASFYLIYPRFGLDTTAIVSCNFMTKVCTLMPILLIFSESQT